MKSATPIAAAVVALLAAGAYLLYGPANPPEVDDTDPSGTEPQFKKPTVPTAITGRMPAPKPVTSITSDERMFRLPDGSYLPSLNGVKSNGARLNWGAGPFSPVDYTFKDQDGLEWYRLKNGDYLTTVSAPGTVGDPPRDVTRDLFVRYQAAKPLPVADPLQIDPKK